MSSLSQKAHKYLVWWYLLVDFPHIYFSLRYFARVFGSMLEWDAIFFAVVKNRFARQVDLAVLVKLIDLFCENFLVRNGKEELDWFRMPEYWLLDFADIVLRTVFWVSTSFLIISSFMQRLFFRRDIFSSKNFSFWLGRLLLTSLFEIFRKRIHFSIQEG